MRSTGKKDAEGTEKEATGFTAAARGSGMASARMDHSAAVNPVATRGVNSRTDCKGPVTGGVKGRYRSLANAGSTVIRGKGAAARVRAEAKVKYAAEAVPKVAAEVTVAALLRVAVEAKVFRVEAAEAAVRTSRATPALP